MPSWANGTDPWAQKLVLAMACLSLAISVAVFIAYCRGGHRRAEKVGTYYTMFAIGWVSYQDFLGFVYDYKLMRMIVHRQLDSLGPRRRRLLQLQEQRQQQGHVGMVLRPKHPIRRLLRQGQVQLGLPPPELVPHLHHHRGRRRGHQHPALQHRLLPILLQAPPAQVHGRPRPRSLRPLSRPASLTVRPQHAWLPSLSKLCRRSHDPGHVPAQVASPEPVRLVASPRPGQLWQPFQHQREEHLYP